MIAVDVDPSIGAFQPDLAAVDPKFGRIEFRLVRRHEPDPGLLPRDAVDGAFLMDVHLIGRVQRGAEDSVEAQVLWLDRVYAALAPGGRLFLREEGGARPPLVQVLRVLALSRFGAKVTVADPSQPSAQPERRGEMGYTVLATK